MKSYGDAAGYEGTNPWWTVRFERSLSPKTRAALQDWLDARFPDLGLFLSEETTHEGRQFEVSADVFCESASEWLYRIHI